MRNERVRQNRGRQKRRSQAVVELAIFGALILLIFNMILTFGQRLDSTQRAKMEAFRKALRTSYYRNAPTSYTLKRDGRIVDANAGFYQGQASSSGASASVMWVKGVPGEWTSLFHGMFNGQVIVDTLLGGGDINGHPENGTPGTANRTNDDVHRAQNFAYYQVNDEVLGDLYGLPMYRKTTKKPGSVGVDLLGKLASVFGSSLHSVDTTEAWVPVGIGKEESARFTRYSSSTGKREDDSTGARAIVNSKNATLSDVINTNLYTRAGRTQQLSADPSDDSNDCVDLNGVATKCDPDAGPGTQFPKLSAGDRYKNRDISDTTPTFRHAIDNSSPNAQFNYSSQVPIDSTGNAMTAPIKRGREWTTNNNDEY